MEDTLSGLNGAPVTPTAGIQGIEPAPALHLCLEELSVMGRQEKNLQDYAMEGTAALEVKQKVLYGFIIIFADSIYVGCFKNFKSVGDAITDNYMTPCLCSGYCSMRNFSLSAVGNRYG